MPNSPRTWKTFWRFIRDFSTRTQVSALCMDEQPVQLVEEVRKVIPATRNHPKRVDYEYRRKGVANIFMFAIKQSMSRAGDCYDNAFMESCFGTIKTELEMTEYKNQAEALKEIRSYINYYNFERKHSAIKYQTPNQFELSLART